MQGVTPGGPHETPTFHQPGRARVSDAGWVVTYTLVTHGSPPPTTYCILSCFLYCIQALAVRLTSDVSREGTKVLAPWRAVRGGAGQRVAAIQKYSRPPRASPNRITRVASARRGLPLGRKIYYSFTNRITQNHVSPGKTKSKIFRPKGSPRLAEATQSQL